MEHQLISEIKKDFIYLKDGGVKNKNTNSTGWVNGNGYLLIDYKKKKYRVHHLVWVLHYGYFPKELDHINGDRLDNRVENLREVDRQNNCRNQKLFKNSSSGITGVSFCLRDKRWRSYITVDYRQLGLGYYEDKEDAVKARKEAEIKYGFHSNHGKVIKTEEDGVDVGY